ncbi:MAG: molecular chaperone DnaJ [Oscillospiraceae bacterium]|jgi:molecular chaperone DnaJ|nr:molecular chaperone DnaJ [Oscillospiraceae bacterium]
MADSKRDYYDILGVPRSASEDEIKKAYRKKTRECHPDLHPGDKEKEQSFKEANEAYEVLSDSQKKSLYDQYGHAGIDPNYGAGAGGGFGGFGDIDLGSIFESFFGGGFGGSGARSNAPRKGQSIRVNLSLSFEEAAFGCDKEIEIQRTDACEDCHGTGAAKGTSAETCRNCNGSGQIRTSTRTPMGVISSSGVCPVCGGTGQTIKTPCPTCKGSGVTKRRVSISVKIPAGIDEGQSVSLRGQGNAGVHHGPSGDVLVTISIRRHDLFIREGSTVHCEIPLTFAQAALGCELEVPTLDGKVKYTVPEGTQPNTVFRLRGKGIPGLNGRARGDQLVHVVLEVPKHLNKKQKDALLAFSATCDEKNHPKGKGFFDKFK